LYVATYPEIIYFHSQRQPTFVNFNTRLSEPLILAYIYGKVEVIMSMYFCASHYITKVSFRVRYKP